MINKKIRKCVKGFSCGFSCISRTRKCSEGKQKAAKEYLNGLEKAVKGSKSAKPAKVAKFQAGVTSRKADLARGFKQWAEEDKLIDALDGGYSVDILNQSRKAAESLGRKTMTIPDYTHSPEMEKKIVKWHKENDSLKEPKPGRFESEGELLAKVMEDNPTQVANVTGWKTEIKDFNTPEEARDYARKVSELHLLKSRFPIELTDDLTREIESYKNSNNPYLKADPEDLTDSKFIRDEIEGFDLDGFDKLAIQDSEGNVQAMSSFSNQKDHIYVEYLATAPWNLAPDHPKRTRGSGAKALSALAQKSIDSGHNGRIRLESMPKAVSFYKKMGFTENDEGFFELSPEAATSLINKYGK